MGKIKNWEKIDDGVWRSTIHDEEVFIIFDNYYYVIIENTQTGEKRQYDNSLRTLAEAKKSAVKYMRSNQDG